MPTHVASGSSTASDPADAAAEALDQVVDGLGAAPDFLFCYATPHYAGHGIARMLIGASDTTLIGGTTCRGVATERGYHDRDGRALGLLGLRAQEGAFGAGIAAQGDAPGAAAQQALLAALEDAGRAGEMPALVWIALAPGREERVLDGIREVLGPEVPVFGGSTADNDVTGQWAQFANGEEGRDHVAVAVLFPDDAVTATYHSGYEPTDIRGRVTRAAGRIVHELDGRPAALVYDEWTQGAISEVIAAGGGNVLHLSTLHPLGREAGILGGTTEFHVLIHPERVEAGGGLALFADVHKGDELTLMRSSRDRLIRRAGLVAGNAVRLGSRHDQPPAGAMTVYCAGCMLAVHECMDEVVAGIRDALDRRPFLTTFTFGEQGCHPATGNHHGNLMISAACFGWHGDA